MGSALARVLRVVWSMASKRPAASFALFSGAVLGTIFIARKKEWPDTGQPHGRGLAHGEVTVCLPDGRSVAIASHGDPRGSPVFLFHGIPASRLGHEFTDVPARERGVRVLCPDRPGIGLSDPQFGRTIHGYSEDVAAVADALGLGRFAVLGLSGGGPYALACGAKLPGRVTAVGVMAGIGPLDKPGAREGMTETDLRLLDLCSRRPLLGRLMLGTMAMLARLAPSVVVTRFADELGEPDSSFLQEGKRELGAAGVLSTLVEAFRQGVEGPAEEYRLGALPWGFALEDVRVPVWLWQGREDRMTPVRHAEDMASQLPRVTLRVLPGTGHLSLTRHFEAVLDAL
ncbi:MAG: alpha/beta fold hydrolase, partial [Rubrobacter sp.]